jgi:hypothetical protein
VTRWLCASRGAPAPFCPWLGGKVQYVRYEQFEDNGVSPLRKYTGILLSALLLVLLAVGFSAWSRSYQGSIDAYSSPLVDVSPPVGEPMPAQTHRVVIILLSGMSYDMAVTVDMPILQTLRKAGADAPVLCQPPTFWQTAWASLITGAAPAHTGLPLLETDPDSMTPVTLDTIFSAARDANLRTAVVGSARWGRLLPSGVVDVLHLTPGEDVQADAAVVQTALGLIGDPQYNLIVIQLSQLEAAAVAEGVGGEGYIGATRQIDSHLRQILRQVNLSNSVLIVTSDVAVGDDGEPAGAGAAPPDLPLIMVGQNVTAGAFSAVSQQDLAPTLALLLGVRVPTAAMGEPLYHFFLLSEEDMVPSRLRVAAQRVTLEDTLAVSLAQPDLAAQSLEDLLTARDAWLAGNSAGAVELAGLVTREATAGIRQAQANALHVEQRTRLPLVLAAVIVPLFLAWMRRLRQGLLLAAAGLLAVTAFYGLYRVLGHRFVFADTLGAEGIVPIGAARDAALGLFLGGLLILLSLLGYERRRWHEAVSISYVYVLVTLYISALPLLFLYWQYGDSLRWYLPPAWAVIVMGLALKQVATVAAAGIGLPWMMGGVVWAVNAWRSHTRPVEQQWDPIAHLRR